ncbi:DNA cytosine methyltransferase [Clavibacter michiganensis]|uniref:DNA cytosine methyltransferase n=1 Tax=Clavibacter michiganensis TaxID=28447 RepID=UPI0026DCCD61|nr:DNA cytosine methyltransferase [Clavibacter michiganensis]MDO4025291.1 DNA cytosine methyltransferase [Clavibacter michiganensis]MDO4035192.1 DNA cytosine methyltransferase [Clavibacter michiganensis]MDO4047192.1 DNA cytosine methyltransferase [Clavibacter michiganensis]MDO4075490.1 DNA cytosine methyltransferase [Clavibacter michiganensis]MDO4106068.1 DNA cytosine methyltransferase [Clavibacter michiganensis]
MLEPRNVTPIASARPKVMEFFAGVGLARMGLESAGFQVTWANDYEPDKHALYERNFRDREAGRDHIYRVGDVFGLDHEELPRDAALAWGSSPCTDLSLAGTRGGLRSGESNAFWGFVDALAALGEERPPVVVLENVVGLATSHGGDDLTAAIRAFNDLGYSIDVLSIDARRFLPQSRPRMFLVGALVPPADAGEQVSALRPAQFSWVFNDPTLRTHRAALPDPPAPRTSGLESIMEKMSGNDSRWWEAERTESFMASLSSVQRDRVALLRKSSHVSYRTAYRRTRNGVATWEVRPDEIAGCLRTARGGSSKQAVVKIEKGVVSVRWMTPLEYARLMGAEDYNIQGTPASKVLFAFGDAVAVPAVEWLGSNYLMPLLKGHLAELESAASIAR